MDIFEKTTRPEQTLLYSRNDPNDPKMGEFVKTDPRAYEAADVVIFGCPQDEGVRRNKGRVGARKAPAEIRRVLYKFSLPENIAARRLFDLGDLIIPSSLEETHALYAKVVQKVLQDGKNIVVLGGGNDISYPDCLALSHSSEKMMAFNIDSHLDVRADEPRNSGTPYRQVIEEGLLQPSRFFEIAVKPFVNSPVYQQYLTEKGAHVYSLDNVREVGIEPLFREILTNYDADAIFWGFDMDSVRTMDAPGVSASYPIGLTAEDICQIAQIAGEDKRTRIFEISEVNPDYDVDHRTCKLAAMMIMYYLAGKQQYK